MRNKKMFKRLQKELERDPFMRFAKINNLSLYRLELNKLIAKEEKHLRQQKIGQREAQRQMDLMEAESRYKHIDDPWTRKHLAYKKLQREKKQINKNKGKFYL